MTYARTRVRSVSALLAAATCTALALGCDDARPSAGSSSDETVFLSKCSGACPGGMQCICGACTTSCTQTPSCEALSVLARCSAVADPACASGAVDHACEVECTTDADCAALSAGHVCDAGRCRRDPPRAIDAGAKNDAAHDGGGVPCGSTTCAPGQLCCPGCAPGSGSCSVGGCPGYACPVPFDSGTSGAPCGDARCPDGQLCCDHCTGSCVGATSGAACPDDLDPHRSCNDSGKDGG